jgi:hypothetical protein
MIESRGIDAAPVHYRSNAYLSVRSESRPTATDSDRATRAGCRGSASAAYRGSADTRSGTRADHRRETCTCTTAQSHHHREAGSQTIANCRRFSTQASRRSRPLQGTRGSGVQGACRVHMGEGARHGERNASGTLLPAQVATPDHPAPGRRMRRNRGTRSVPGAERITGTPIRQRGTLRIGMSPRGSRCTHTSQDAMGTCFRQRRACAHEIGPPDLGRCDGEAIAA